MSLLANQTPSFVFLSPNTVNSAHTVRRFFFVQTHIIFPLRRLSESISMIHHTDNNQSGRIAPGHTPAISAAKAAKRKKRAMPYSTIQQLSFWISPCTRLKQSKSAASSIPFSTPNRDKISISAIVYSMIFQQASFLSLNEVILKKEYTVQIRDTLEWLFQSS